jgi:hypothetical protein
VVDELDVPQLAANRHFKNVTGRPPAFAAFFLAILRPEFQHLLSPYDAAPSFARNS